MSCFSGDQKLENINREDIDVPLVESNKVMRYIHWAKLSNDVTAVVTPFLGGVYGLNSDALLQAGGDKIRAVSGFT
jgi:hypothetical protein